MTAETWTDPVSGDELAVVDGGVLDIRHDADLGKLTDDQLLDERLTIKALLREHDPKDDELWAAYDRRTWLEGLRLAGRNGHASASELQAAMALGGRIAAEGAAKAAARSGYAAGVRDGKAQAEAEAAKRRPPAPTISVERDERGRPTTITETSVDGTVVVKHVERDELGRVARLVVVSE